MLSTIQYAIFFFYSFYLRMYVRSKRQNHNRLVPLEQIDWTSPNQQINDLLCKQMTMQSKATHSLNRQNSGLIDREELQSMESGHR